jgi:tRNA A37 threonylcarbamoyltransferase TsaD
MPICLSARHLSTDNAVMIGMAGYLQQKREGLGTQDNAQISADGNLALSNKK